MTLQGANASAIDVIEGEQLSKMLQVKGAAFVIQAVEVEEEGLSPCLEELQQVLREYQVVFASPKGLPPSRACSHKIPLIDLTLTVNARLQDLTDIHSIKRMR